MNGLHLIRHLNDQATREANEAREANERNDELERLRLKTITAVDEAREANKKTVFPDVDPAPSSVLRGLHLDSADTAVPNEANEAQDYERSGFSDGHDEAMLVGDIFREINEEINEANEANGTIKERLAVIQEKTDPAMIELILTMAAQCPEFGLAGLLLNVLSVDNDEVLADEMMQEILSRDIESAGHVLAHMQDLISD